MAVNLLEGLDPSNLADGDSSRCAPPCTPTSGGVVQMRDGTRYYSMVVGPDSDGDIVIRIESGEYAGYTREGRRCFLNDRRRYEPYPGESGMDIVEFIRCEWSDPRAKGLGSDYYAARREA